MDTPKTLLNIADRVPGLVALYNIRTGKYLYVNNAIKKLLGYDPEEFLNGGLAFATSLIHPEDLAKISTENAEAMGRANKKDMNDEELIAAFEYRMRHKNGSYRWLQTNGSVYGRTPAGEIELILNVSVDITDRKESAAKLVEAQREVAQAKEIEKKLRESEERYRNLVEAVEDYAIFALDPDGNITSWNQGVEYIMGYTQEEILGKHCRELFTQKDRDLGVPETELVQASIQKDLIAEGLRVRKDGSVFHAVSTITAIRDEFGNLKGFSKIMRDVTEKKEAEETIRYQAYHDSLTGLVNRKAMDDRFAQARTEAQLDNHKIAVLFLDLDRFKNINDTLGHVIGDLILKEVADRINHVMRTKDTVARLGGDEFIMLLTDVQHVNDVAKIAKKILETFTPVLRVQNHSLHVSASLGIAMYPEDGQDLYTLLKNADTALYRAKDAGRNRHQFYNHKMNLLSAVKFSLEQDLRSAVELNQLQMVYQPFIEIATGKVNGVEALVRWNHPKLGMLYPQDFIALAEETGMIVPIGNWILRTVCTQGRRWHDSGLFLKIAVNLSGRQFVEPRITENITQILEETNFEPTFLDLEITESVVMENINRTGNKLANLKENGVTIVIDDFGTGYSSLSYLRRFPVHKFKIDRTFIKNAVTEKQDAAIIQAVISMGHSLGLKVCVEGIENKQQLDLVATMDCSYAQGYYISRPLYATELTSWLNRSTPMIQPTLPLQNTLNNN